MKPSTAYPCPAKGETEEPPNTFSHVTRVPLDLADLLREHWPYYVRAHCSRLAGAHSRAVARVLACRTPALGGRLYQCGSCQKNHFAYHSCNHRNCPRCGSAEQEEWTAQQEAKLLPVPYFFLTFTLPQELRVLGLRFPKEFYGLLMRESAAALHAVAATKLKRSRLRLGLTSVLHTWGRQMQHHPHVHAIVPALGYCHERDQLVHPKDDQFLVHYRPLADRFRNRMRETLRAEHPDIYQQLTSKQLQALAPGTTWNVRIQPAGTGRTTVRYLARYVRRTAFHPKRLLGYDKKGRVMLRWTSSQTGESNILHLHPHEFIRRWLQHTLPKGFARVRHYGFHSSASKKIRARVRLLSGCGGEPVVELPERPPHTCPCCGGELKFLREIERIPVHLSPRGPPQPHHAR